MSAAAFVIPGIMRTRLWRAITFHGEASIKVSSITHCAAAAIAALLWTGCVESGRFMTATPDELDRAVRTAWREIGTSRSRCDSYDYFPRGGMRNFYCHLMNYMEYGRFRELVGVPAFTSGPHGEKSLVLDAPDSFGHYNREFVARLRRVILPAGRDGAFRAATQAVYDRSVRPLARIFYVTYNTLKQNPAFRDQEMGEYRARLADRSAVAGSYEKYFYFMNPGFFNNQGDESYLMDHGFDGGWNGNVVKTAVAFWIRRSIDGTADEFYAGLIDLLNLYDAAAVNGGAEPDGAGD